MAHSAPPPTPLGLEPTFGFGDRLGLATPGHIDALRSAGGPIQPIFAQQSIREMTRTGRSAAQVIADAAESLSDEGFAGPWGADADHLKTAADVEATARAGFVFFTIDPSDHVDQAADDYDAQTLRAKFEQAAGEVGWIDAYRGRTIRIDDGPLLQFDTTVIERAVVKYGRAIAEALTLAGHIQQAAEANALSYELELSVDETAQPTTLAEHYIIADRFRAAGVRLVSLAPRFVGDFEKGVDYKGDLRVLEGSLADHAAIARQLGPYKLSLHSGSDKLSMYGPFARATRGRFHVKTAGTSYLEALRVVARHDEPLFRRVVGFARQHYDRDRATYHVSATVDGVPAPGDVAGVEQLEGIYLENWGPGRTAAEGFTNPGRQILHCTFGSVLTDPQLGPAVRAVLVDNPRTHRQVLCEHFGHHLEALRSGLGRV